MKEEFKKLLDVSIFDEVIEELKQETEERYNKILKTVPTEFIFIGNKLERERYMRVKNDFWIKPTGGLWASPYRLHGNYKSAWQEYIEVELGHKNIKGGYKFTIDVNPRRALVIDSLQDLEDILEGYSVDSVLSFYKVLDFEKISKDYDFIFLTEDGQWKTRLTKPNLYGWDVECILILNPNIINFDSQEYIKL